jgi:superfamily II RNA helicase
MLFRMLVVGLLLMVSCRGDYRRAQWHYNAIVVRYNEIVEVSERLEKGFSDTTSYRAVNEKMDSIEMLLGKLQLILDTLSLPDEDDRVKVAMTNWVSTMKEQVCPDYQQKIEVWKMLHIQQNNQDIMRIKQLTSDLEEKKKKLNEELTPVLEEFVEDYKLSYRP